MITLTSTGGFVILPNPVLGDSEQLDTKQTFDFSMSCKVHTAIKTTSHSKILLSFEQLTATQVASIKTFLLASRGLSVTYTDYDSVAWIGTIIGDPFEFISIGENECEKLWTWNVEFEAINT